MLCLATALAYGLDAREVMQEVERRQQFKTLQQSATLTVTEADGNVSTKRWTVISSGAKENRQVRIRFSYPHEVRGVGLLILNKPKGPAMQWMWIPSLGRDRRIAPQDRGGQVFDADLTFEDLEERSLDNYFIGESKTDSSQGRPCFRIELTPKDPRTSQYSASEVWVDQQRFVILKVESKKQAKVVRVMEFQDIRDVQGIPTPHRLDAFSPATGSRTILTTQSVVYNAPLSASEFTREAMKRAQ